MVSGTKDVISADPTDAVDVERFEDSRRSIRDMTILPSRMRSRIAIPYGE